MHAHGQSVDEHPFDRCFQPCDGVAHPSLEGHGDADGVDVSRGDVNDTPRERHLAYTCRDRFSPLRAEAFAVVQTLDTRTRGQDARPDSQWTGERTTPDLIHARDAGVALGSQMVLKSIELAQPDLFGTFGGQSASGGFRNGSDPLTGVAITLFENILKTRAGGPADQSADLGD
jgi:hypothetical protein